MQEGKLTLVLGGTRSGKSSFAEKLAQGLGDRVLYLATAAVYDEEMAQRVKEHRRRRPASWVTIEETIDLAKVVEKYAQEYEVILIDCLTLWLTNLLLREAQSDMGSVKEAFILQEVEKVAELCQNTAANVIIVSNEVGLGIVPDTPMGRQFRDLAGAANQIMARYAKAVYLVIAGLPVELKALALPMK
ncbi:bifunctional adenosylcobinamide kinase/adenosylcobinamide-phosphate guanylyltransferase [Desulforamulus ferrireducens]|uniref:Adenosylcobinamide kinase n=1 Tax=Desulforamulus ferrireducens TaxID=1833852 RepID=A0A1S6IWY7_9FIRM|nr:bifunctional adenosylcobinamide kinase/adenosylcobinamide-phosphate guanylyltransferase [Desulforamulus ferrireducens]AQS59289.1 bifunctional adenosylcobinamide kinase/adenosylcobinamide-phosphate guanylyltransferase [Desulforamulus ferrireducens]